MKRKLFILAAIVGLMLVSAPAQAGTRVGKSDPAGTRVGSEINGTRVGAIVN